MSNGESVKLLWRYSIDTPTWRAGTVTSVDYSTMVMGYAMNYLPSGFYYNYAKGTEEETTTTETPTTTTGK